MILDTSDGESCVVEGHDVTFFVEDDCEGTFVAVLGVGQLL